MTPFLITHIGAGSPALLSGAAALSVRKGERLHRVFGTVFFLAMLTTSAMGTYLALTLPQGTTLRATAIVGIFTFYFVVTAWATVRRQEPGIGLFEKAGFLVASGAALALPFFGLMAANSATGLLDGAPPAPYFVFGPSRPLSPRSTST